MRSFISETFGSAPELMWLQAMFGAELNGGQTTIVEGADTFTPKFATLLAGHVFWHIQKPPDA
ncbi:hypothetical protein URH17368_0858 [Alicyclobacillus hesperidum URH17-3-68]|nr:hypothetical protein [Alicyclobacillus hesperidum]EJY56467.1 hypothetical protein URH17368_0858 [Alicyclobacillus hesperidum URH17-3-68]